METPHLLHGEYDAVADREVIFAAALPVWAGHFTTTIPWDYSVFTPIGSPVESGGGSASYSTESVALGIHPSTVHFPTTFGLWLWREVQTVRWTLQLHDAGARGSIELEMTCGPGFGPLHIKLDGQAHSTTRAVVGGVVHGGSSSAPRDGQRLVSR